MLLEQDKSMRLNEIIVENTELDEAPKGFLSRMKDKVLSKVPGGVGDKAQGRLELGKEANLIKKEFMKFLGTQDQGQGATPDMVLNWLAKNGYPTDGAKAEMRKVTGTAKAGQAVGKAAAGAAKGVAAVGKGIAKGVGAVAKGVGDVAKGAVAGAKDAVADPNAQKTDPNAAQQDVKTATTSQPATQSQIDAANKGADAIAMKGVKKTPPATQQKKVVNQSVDFSTVSTLMEGLTGGQLDNIFMAAVKDAIARDDGGQAKSADTSFSGDAAKGGAGGFMAGLAQGAKGDKAIPKEVQAQLDQLTAKQKFELGKLI